ncbi:nucleotide exchange factor GrpE [Virgibacillus profundi]|uniref:Protein GrpE n=1 Tax=Virgibacillus profundi TaxID=2024555 RepID=A0A2A2ICL7_9BACI|nr:nucleotide exchange factor GrpE [Virgibacillus profundi]PAV29014.1 nucleotide exchange factor GrpE [Virgibacillus profundi]PXY53183.1 nucleotide exchange factor GrpE [Virgibacillus profundi]
MEKQEKDMFTEEESKSNDESEVIEVIDSEENETNVSEDSEPETLQKDYQSLQQEKDEMSQRLLRLQAEFDNFKKRSQKEKDADRKYKSQDLVNELLPAIDNFERALQVEVTEATSSLIEGITMVYRQLQDALKSQDVEVIESEGKEFDPNLHHAVMQVEDGEMDSNIVVEELQKGYMLKDRVIRPAMVKVNK